MGRGIRIIVCSCLLFVLIANLAFFAFTQKGVLSTNWANISVMPNVSSHYEYRGFKYFYEYLSTFPFLTTSISTVNRVAAIVSGEIHYTGWTAVNFFIGIIEVLSSPVMLIIAFVSDIVNMFLWFLGFFVPTLL